jgi:DNA repair exonuclease SbcCD ATPase subunit
MINLKTLHLDGWLSYDSATIPLNEEGITLVTGAIGSGKSAIPEAIFYLLFGKTLRKKDTVANLANKIIKNGYEIALDFDIDGVPHCIKEVRDRPNSGLFFDVNGTSNRGKGDTQTRKLILDALGIGAAEFRSIAFLGQRQTQLLVEGTPGERGATVMSIFALDAYNELINTCTADLDATLAGRDELTSALTRAEEEFSELSEAIPAVPDGALGQLEAQLQDLVVTLRQAQDKLVAVRLKYGETKKVAGILDALEAQRAQRETLKSKLAKIEKEIQSIPTIKHSKTQVAEKLKEYAQKKARAEARISECEREITRASKLSNTCPVINQDCPCDVPKNHSDEIKSRSEAVLVKASTTKEKLRSRIKKLDRMKGTIEKKERLSYRLEETKDSIRSLEPNDRVAKDLKKKIAKLDDLEELVQRREDQVNDIRDKKSNVATAHAALTERAALAEKLENTINERKTAIAMLKSKIRLQDNKVQYLSAAINVFKRMKMFKIDLVLELLNTYLKDILARISNNEYHADFRSQQLSADKRRTLDKLSIIVYDGFKELPVELCSGGQATEVGLAVLLSTWKAANSISRKGVSSLWLDEVFGPLNEEIINRVFDTVTQIAKELGTTSVNIISHRALDPRLADRIWHTERTNGISQIAIA